MQNHYYRMGEEQKFLSMASPPPPKPTTSPHPKPQPFTCPRCHSSNTKFCYYNNYSLSQPRYFCKACKRYWTHGGTLRNVPVGGGCRKNKRLRRPPPSSTPADVPPPAASPRPTALLHAGADFSPEVRLPFPGFVDPHAPPGYGLHLPPFTFGFPADPVFAAPGVLGSSSSSGLLDDLGSGVAQQQRWANGFRDGALPYRGKKPSHALEDGNLSKTCLNDGLIRELDSSQNWASWSSDLTSMGSSLTSLF